MTELHELTIADARALMDRGELTSVQLTEALLARIAAVEPQVHAFLSVPAEAALEQARAADKTAGASRTSPLHGIPIAIKDVISTAGMTTTCGSRMLENYVPPYDATVVARLKEAGAVIFGKTNCDEFAMGSSTENSAFEATRNPWDLERVPGGSSGGSAAAVAASEAPGSLGTDTGGSIRQPASLCGITGLKPTYGRVSRYGLVAFGSSLDQIGPFAWTARDCAMLMGALAGADPNDGTTVPQPVPDYTAALSGDVRGLRVGVPREYFVDGIEPGVEQAVRAAIDVLREQGAEIVDISLPHTKYALPVYYIIAPAEASANLARYDGVRYGRHVSDETYWDELEKTRGSGFGAEVRRRIMLGTYALSAGYYDAYYKRAQQVRTLIRRDFQQAFEQIDVIAAPTAPTVAFKIGEKTDDPLAMYLEDVCTLPISLAGLPGLVVPCGFSGADTQVQPLLPVGLQLVGRPFDEPTLLRVGDAFQHVTDWHARRPTLR
ncbi:MAG TPA: Asp-tRNA(Asn)/Glu-tRNA(Gln) amidotransferase subunit GatA [Roseiflexaceae bacterium]|jgi:aspartyl-tRNA(Asn)/glutamyl-tRNA(Gln) amidotransferase subunit A|nr:Asp-tRNA(Asn)/Glu-tRNA(Gln) amidotransferase subunit GatA [Roseiflexaceae bacterium]